MVRGILERVLGAPALDTLYDRVVDRQYTRQLLFSSVFQLMYLVVCRIQPSIHAAYQDNQEAIETSITAVYDKLNGIDTVTSQALVQETAKQMGESVRAMKGSCLPWLPGYRIKVLDGNCIEATEHRLEVLRRIGGGALPGKSLVIYEPELEMATAVFPCEDGHAQERSLLGELLPTLAARDILIMDRNFCVRAFLHGISVQQAYFICRQHQGLPGEAVGEERFSGVVRAVHSMSSGSGSARATAMVVSIGAFASSLKRPHVMATRSCVLTNLSKTAAPAKLIAEMYRKRWSIETAFQERGGPPSF